MNDAPCPIEAWWVDYQCHEELYDTVQPGRQVVESTFVTHPWRLRAAGSEQLLLEIAPATDGTPRTVTYP